jgi:transposase
MAKARSFVGLDVHAPKVVAAVLDVETGELAFFGMEMDVDRVAGFCAALPSPVAAAYEAGPTGYGLARALTGRGVASTVAAPSKIPRGSGERVKTDRRDAELLARLLWAGKLSAVRVPGDEEEALRDLVRARESVRQDLMRARHRLSKLLLRRGIRFDDGHAWTERHRQWLEQITLDWPAAQTTLIDAKGRDRRAHSPPRAARTRDSRAAAQLAVECAGRSAAVPARYRHADRGRAVRRGRRF